MCSVCLGLTVCNQIESWVPRFGFCFCFCFCLICIFVDEDIRRRHNTIQNNTDWGTRCSRNDHIYLATYIVFCTKNRSSVSEMLWIWIVPSIQKRNETKQNNNNYIIVAGFFLFLILTHSVICISVFFLLVQRISNSIKIAFNITILNILNENIHIKWNSSITNSLFFFI